MDFTKYKNQQLQLNRCQLHVERTKAEVERIFSDTFGFKNKEDQRAALVIAEENYRSAVVTFNNQLRINAIENGFIDEGHLSISNFLDDSIKMLSQDLKATSPDNKYLNMNIITEINAFKRVKTFIGGLIS